ncbi:MAG TPA: helix-turn-helix domain-containing protein [Kofleriaceae bacterium]|jgi:hypothetical protein|nr:helix-turn-helix domain-containing protein [Kofleriaceae bacterium]
MTTNETPDRERALTTQQAASIVGAAIATLAQWRWLGKGPPFFRTDRRHVRYRLGDLLDWRDAHTHQPGTVAQGPGLAEGGAPMT